MRHRNVQCTEIFGERQVQCYNILEQFEFAPAAGLAFIDRLLAALLDEIHADHSAIPSPSDPRAQSF